MVSTFYFSEVCVLVTNIPLGASFVARMVKNLPAMQENWVRSLGQEVLLEKGMATYSSILAWRIPWTEESVGLLSVGSQRVGHDWATKHVVVKFHQGREYMKSSSEEHCVCVCVHACAYAWKLGWVQFIPSFPGGTSGKEPACQCRRHRDVVLIPGLVRFPWRRKWQPTPAPLPGESHGRRSLAGDGPWGCTESTRLSALVHAHTPWLRSTQKGGPVNGRYSDPNSGFRSDVDESEEPRTHFRRAGPPGPKRKSCSAEHAVSGGDTHGADYV